MKPVTKVIIRGMLSMLLALLISGCWKTIDKVMTSEAWNHIDTSSLQTDQNNNFDPYYGSHTHPQYSDFSRDSQCYTCYRVGNGQASHWDKTFREWSEYDKIPEKGEILRHQINNDDSIIGEKTVRVADIVEFKYVPHDKSRKLFFKKYPILEVRTCVREEYEPPSCFTNSHRFKSDSLAETTDNIYHHQSATHQNHTVMYYSY